MRTALLQADTWREQVQACMQAAPKDRMRKYMAAS